MHFVLGGPFSEQAQDDASGVRHERAHGGPLPASGGLRTEDAVRHVVPRLDDPLDLIGAQGRRLVRAQGQEVQESAIRGRSPADPWSSRSVVSSQTMAEPGVSRSVSHVQFDSTKLRRRRFSRGSCFANSLWALRASSKKYTLVHVRFIGILVPLNLAKAAALLFTPLVRPAVRHAEVPKR
jgi:hypothetical protein